MKRIALILVVIAAVAAPAAAQAQSDGYTNVPGATQNSVDPGESSATSGSPAGTVASTGDSGSSVLPFTGLQLALIFGAGVVLLATGLLLRRARLE